MICLVASITSILYIFCMGYLFSDFEQSGTVQVKAQIQGKDII